MIPLDDLLVHPTALETCIFKRALGAGPMIPVVEVQRKVTWDLAFQAHWPRGWLLSLALKSPQWPDEGDLEALPSQVRSTDPG